MRGHSLKRYWPVQVVDATSFTKLVTHGVIRHGSLSSLCRSCSSMTRNLKFSILARVSHIRSTALSSHSHQQAFLSTQYRDLTSYFGHLPAPLLISTSPSALRHTSGNTHTLHSLPKEILTRPRGVYQIIYYKAIEEKLKVCLGVQRGGMRSE